MPVDFFGTSVGCELLAVGFCRFLVFKSEGCDNDVGLELALANFLSPSVDCEFLAIGFDGGLLVLAKGCREDDVSLGLPFHANDFMRAIR